MRLLIFTFIVSVFLLFPLASAQPAITSVSGNIVNGQSFTITGSGFGTKSQAAPFRSSYMNPVSAMNFQSTGSFSSSYWDLVGPVMITLQGGTVRVPGRQYVRLEYSERANNDGYTAGLQTDVTQTKDYYFAWWEYFAPGFNPSVMSTGNSNFKWVYNSAGHALHEAAALMSDGTAIYIAVAGGLDGATREEQNANLILPLGGGFYSRPNSWAATFPFSTGNWRFMEEWTHLNSDPYVFDGWTEMRMNNQILYHANHADFFDGNGEDYYSNIRFGGNYGWYGGSEVFYRYYGDIYVDGTFQRVVVCENSNYDNCNHIEVQIPTSWSGGSITATANQGTFQNGQTLYVFVFDSSNERSNGIPITVGGTPPSSCSSSSGTCCSSGQSCSGSFVTSSDCGTLCCVGTCQNPAVCGNNILETGEQCDDGNTITETCTYGQTSCIVCSSTCQNVAGATSYCGDGTCDPSNENAASCSQDCSSPTCTDLDGDDYGVGSACLGPDCDDSDPNVHQNITCSYDGNACGSFSMCIEACPTPPQEDCDDNQDNDCDGQTDCSDADCFGSQYCLTGSTITLYPVEDTYGDSFTPDTIHGNEDQLKNDGSPPANIFIKFDASGISGGISSAVLRLYVVDSSTFGGNFFMTPATWSEASLTWNNMPSMGNAIGSLGTVDLNVWYELDVTNQVTGSGVYSFGGTSNIANGAFYASRESSHSPELVITLAGGSGNPGDLNTDGIVNVFDLVIIGSHFNLNTTSPNWDARADPTGEGEVDINDLVLVAGNFGNIY